MNGERGILLDVSRLISRIGGGALTGIDRVEAEWLRHLQGRDHLLLCRVRGGQLLLPPQAGPAILRWIGGEIAELPPPAWFDRLRGRDTPRLRAEHALRRRAILWAPRNLRGIAAAVLARLGPGTAYLNAGHANLDRRVLAALAPLRRAVLIHDTIPLDHPEFTRDGQSEKFRSRFMVAVGMADVILTVSQASADRVALWRKRLAGPGRAPIHAAPIGTTLAAPDETGLPPRLDLERSFFVTIGTIEPRKNHALLLDVWERLAQRHPAPTLPQLFIIGRRGWKNAAVFARLDALPPDGPVRELAGLDDGAVAALLLRSRALVMPSRAEGFGLPLTEAAGRGIPVLCAPLPSAIELLGDHAHYLPPDDIAAWTDEIARLADQPPLRNAALPPPDWERHFRTVYNALMENRN